MRKGLEFAPQQVPSHSWVDWWGWWEADGKSDGKIGLNSGTATYTHTLSCYSLLGNSVVTHVDVQFSNSVGPISEFIVTCLNSSIH